MKIVPTFLATLFFSTTIWLFYMVVEAFFLPEPFMAELPDFQGRILPAEAVKVGTFSINTEFDSTSTWGNDGVLTYQPVMLGESNRFCACILLNAWRPDRQTPGAFQHAFKVVKAPTSWSIFHSIDFLKIEQNKLMAIPTVDFAPVAFCTILMILSFILSIIFYSWPRI